MFRAKGFPEHFRRFIRHSPRVQTKAAGPQVIYLEVHGTHSPIRTVLMTVLISILGHSRGL